MRYVPTAADRAAAPASYPSEARYLGYRDDDYQSPWAPYFQEESQPVQEHVKDALISGPSPSEYGFSVDEAADVMSRPGYRKLETGYTEMDDGQLMVAALTKMPNVTGEMWDWWFGWHGTDTTRYKLWHPDAHYYSAMGQDRRANRELTDRQRYIDNVSYVDEYLGEKRSPLTVRFFDPTKLGFPEAPRGGTTVVARGGLSTLPISFAWLIHQVRPTDDGCEMRSRFIVNSFEVLDLPAHSVTSPAGKMLANPLTRKVGRAPIAKVGRQDLRVFGPDMLQHCAQEMNHLATFLPSLYEEFRDIP
ncbi:DAPG hydrolase family protein [Gordonia zhaorongruii]|uniref:DAPG hydrolase family protein n=1 Tax=Gordonia zhaorongruii TaxID=2597659 RepID=UPI00104A1EE5|nr:hypothetical protein [Gordonia zhaorongruii]